MQCSTRGTGSSLLFTIDCTQSTNKKNIEGKNDQNKIDTGRDKQKTETEAFNPVGAFH